MVSQRKKKPSMTLRMRGRKRRVEEDVKDEEEEEDWSGRGETKYFPADLGAVTWMPKGENRRDEKMKGRTTESERGRGRSKQEKQEVFHSRTYEWSR